MKPLRDYLKFNGFKPHTSIGCWKRGNIVFIPDINPITKKSTSICFYNGENHITLNTKRHLRLFMNIYFAEDLKEF